MTELALGLDLGGTKIRAGLVDSEGKLIVANTSATNIREGREGIMNSIISAIVPLLTRARREKKLLLGIGVSAAGVINVRSGSVLDATDSLPNWKGTRLGYLLEEEFGIYVGTDNDVNCALLGEQWLGGAQSYNSVVMLTLGTGLGGAMLTNGQMLHGSSYLAGHWGRMEVPHPYRPQMNVPLESLLSGTGLRETLLFQLPEAEHQRYPDGLSVMQAYSERDPKVIATVEDFMRLLSRTISNIRWTMDPQLVLLGGGMINSREYWWELMNQYLKEMGVMTPVRPATLGNDAGMYGAAKMVFNHFEELKQQRD
ncbi:ROK family protein [Vibrio campbellii]|uniref:ROK family protein n=1 Tax=Vibrio campbellii TaxID=680 RepID=UPI0005EFBE8D|nr:ROK family protein [Vibrio campbellii]MCR9910430.1 ROK family protein [Vibrio campbellii]